jgi:hypothetical protein
VRARDSRVGRQLVGASELDAAKPLEQMR